MSEAVAVLRTHARSLPAADRSALGIALGDVGSDGLVRLETCHRLEVYGTRTAVLALADHPFRSRSELLIEQDAARHVIRLAVGLDSVVLGEDQVLHQLREAVASARRVGRLDPALERLLDLALGAGRRARTWMPGRRASLADVAVAALGPVPNDRPVLVVGSGDMGRRAARLIAGSGRGLLVASRSASRAAALASSLGGEGLLFDPGPEVMRSVGGVIVALRGPWAIATDTADAIEAADPIRLVDLSMPSAIEADLAGRLGTRLVDIDDLTGSAVPSAPLEPRLIERLEALAEEALTSYLDWLTRSDQRSTARALVHRAHEEREAELADLWRAVPGLAGPERDAVAAMARRLSERLLREPLHRLGQDADGRRDQAARDLFGL